LDNQHIRLVCQPIHFAGQDSGSAAARSVLEPLTKHSLFFFFEKTQIASLFLFFVHCEIVTGYRLHMFSADSLQNGPQRMWTLLLSMMT
jgi:hypothetical protein